MADPNIQTLRFPVNTGTPGLIKTYTAEVNKKTGAMVVYDTTNAFQKDPVIRNDFTVGTADPEKKWRSDYFWDPEAYENYIKLSKEEKRFLREVVEPQAINQRAAFINKNYTQDQKNNLFPNMPKVQNTAPSNPLATAGGSNPTNPNLKAFKLDEETNLKAKEGTRGNFPKNLRYPENMSSQQDKLKIDMLKFSKRNFIKEKLIFGERDIQSTIGSVVLAIPGGITDDNRVNWGSADMGAGEAALAMFALDFIKNGGDAIGAFGKGIQDIAGTSKELQTGFAAFLADQAAGVKGLLARTEGAVLNPNTELLFQGPALRAFTFNFKLSPRSEKEAVMVRNIIRFFKQGMAVQRTQTELFLKAPHIFKLTFLKGEKETHAFLPQFKLCALLNCSVNYTPEGNYTTFKDSSMVSYEMSLTFNELDPIFNDEYPTDGDATIGF